MSTTPPQPPYTGVPVSSNPGASSPAKPNAITVAQIGSYLDLVAGLAAAFGPNWFKTAHGQAVLTDIVTAIHAVAVGLQGAAQPQQSIWGSAGTS